MSAQAEVTKDNEAEVVVALTPEQLAEKEAKEQAEKVVADEKELVELLKLVTSGKASPNDYSRLAVLSSEKAQREEQKEEAEKGQKLLAFVTDTLKLDAKQAIALLRPHVPATTATSTSQASVTGKEVYIRWVDANNVVHERVDGDRPANSWVKDMIKALSKADAMKCIVATSEKGKTKARDFINKQYDR